MIYGQQYLEVCLASTGGWNVELVIEPLRKDCGFEASRIVLSTFWDCEEADLYAESLRPSLDKTITSFKENN
jgi:hypothetical protein